MSQSEDLKKTAHIFGSIPQVLGNGVFPPKWVRYNTSLCDIYGMHNVLVFLDVGL